MHPDLFDSQYHFHLKLNFVFSVLLVKLYFGEESFCWFVVPKFSSQLTWIFQGKSVFPWKSHIGCALKQWYYRSVVLSFWSKPFPPIFSFQFSKPSTWHPAYVYDTKLWCLFHFQVSQFGHFGQDTSVLDWRLEAIQIWLDAIQICGEIPLLDMSYV